MGEERTTRRRHPQLHAVNTGKQSSEDIMRRSKRKHYIYALLIFVLVGLFIVIYWPSGSSTDGVQVLHGMTGSFAKVVARNGVPVVLKDTFVTRWKAFEEWDPAYLTTRVIKFSGVYVNDNRWFGPYYDGRKPLAKYCLREHHYITDLEIPGRDFFELLFQPNHGEYLYFTSDIDSVGRWAFDEVQPINELLLLNPKSSSVNLWMGQPGVIAHCHYDGYHNFYVQLFGRKTFRLFSPANWPGLYPFPYLHPSHAQAQVNLSDTSSRQRFRAVSRVLFYEVTLTPGDLLYIPPLWFHEVEALDVSISVNVWTSPRQATHMTNVFSTSVPFEFVKSKKLKVLSATFLVQQLLHSICKKKVCKDPMTDIFFDGNKEIPVKQSIYFINRLWRVRYKMIMDSGKLPQSLPRGMSCEEKAFTKEEILAELQQDNVNKFIISVMNYVTKVPDSTWELWMGNYIEYLVSLAVGVEHVGAFLKHFELCLI